jgi:hypothetical protein
MLHGSESVSQLVFQIQQDRVSLCFGLSCMPLIPLYSSLMLLGWMRMGWSVNICGVHGITLFFCALFWFLFSHLLLQQAYDQRSHHFTVVQIQTTGFIQTFWDLLHILCELWFFSFLTTHFFLAHNAFGLTLQSGVNGTLKSKANCIQEQQTLLATNSID